MSGEREKRLLIAATSWGLEKGDEGYLADTLNLVKAAGLEYVLGNVNEVDEARLIGLLGGAAVLWSVKGGYEIMRFDVNRWVQEMERTGTIPAGYSDNDYTNLRRVTEGGKAYYCMHAGMASTWSQESIRQTMELFSTGKGPELKGETMEAVVTSGTARGTLIAAGTAQLVEWMAIDGYKKLPDELVLFVEDNLQHWTKHIRDLRVLYMNQVLRDKIKGVVVGRRIGMMPEGDVTSAADALAKYREVFSPANWPKGVPVTGIVPIFGHADDDDMGARFVPLVMGQTVEISMQENTGFGMRYT